MHIQVEAARIKGRELPDWFLNRPEARSGDEVYLNAFQYLSGGRIQSESYTNPIHWRDSLDYAHHLLGMDRDDAMTFIYVINEMDREYLADLHAQAKGRASAEDAKDRALGKGR